MSQVGYYDQEFEPWARGIRSIGTMIAQQPVLRAQAEQRRSAAAYNQARIATEGTQQEHYRAGTGKMNAETANLLKKGQLVTALEQSAAQAQQDIASGNTDTEAVRTFSGAASALTGANGDDIIESARKGIGTILGRMGKVTEAASTENPVDIEKARIASKRGMVVQPGGAVFDPNAGKAVFQNPSAASQREGEYETTTMEYPEVAGSPGVPGKPAVQRSFMGIDALAKDTPAVPGKPAVPGQPARKVTTRRKLGDAAASTDIPARPMREASKPLDKATAQQLLQEAGGDKAKARELAAQRGYTF
jgi:hypothetical protein